MKASFRDTRWNSSGLNILIEAQDENERILLSQFADAQAKDRDLKFHIHNHGYKGGLSGCTSILIGYVKLSDCRRYKRERLLRPLRNLLRALMFWRWRFNMSYKEGGN